MVKEEEVRGVWSEGWLPVLFNICLVGGGVCLFFCFSSRFFALRVLVWCFGASNGHVEVLSLWIFAFIHTYILVHLSTWESACSIYWIISLHQPVGHHRRSPKLRQLLHCAWSLHKPLFRGLGELKGGGNSGVGACGKVGWSQGREGGGNKARKYGEEGWIVSPGH